MRNLNQLNQYRISNPTLSEMYGPQDEKFGIFLIQYRSATLRMIASAKNGWDHVSVSLEHRTPTWEEMDYIKQVFFKPNEIAIQYHVAREDHVNIHPNCLHLWRPHNPRIILMPPKTLV